MSQAKPKTQAVTGAFGFSGKYVAARLLAAGHRVITLTGSPGRANPFAGKVEAFPFDFAHPESMAEALAGTEVLYNTYWVRFNRKDPKTGQPDHAEALQNSLALFQAAKLAGVRKIVHISVANADPESPLPYYRGKGLVEKVLRELADYDNDAPNYSIVRPAMLFGPGSVLLNNLAWNLRRFPVCVMFGNGRYRLQPIFVEDLAELLIREGEKTENSTVYALGPDDFEYRELMRALGEILGHRRPTLGLPAWMAYPGVWLLGKIMGDALVSNDEIKALTGNLLQVTDPPQGTPAGTKHLLDWARENADTLGSRFISESGRRKDKSKAY